METIESTPRSMYANLTNDYMFKRVFGSEECKDILLIFLNHVVGNGEIEDVTFLNTEQLGPSGDDRKAVFDIYVKTWAGDEYIIEMQLAQQAHFRDRALFYMSYPILNQAAQAKEQHIGKYGDSTSFRWNFCLKPVRFIAVVNFSFDHEPGWEPQKYYSSYRLREDDTGELMMDKLQFIFLELARFDKTEDELDGYYDKWMYLLKNMPYLKGRPRNFDGKEFDRLFEMAELCNFTAEQYRSYQNSQNMIYDYENTIDFAEQKGEVKKAMEIAKNLKRMGLDDSSIIQATGLTAVEVEAL